MIVAMIESSPVTAPASVAPLPAELTGGFGPSERALLDRAWARAQPLYGDRRVGTGESVADHALALAAMLASLRLDAATCAAGLLFAASEYLDGAREKIEAEFGREVALLVAGIARLHGLRLITRGVAGQEASTGKSAQAEVLRKMLLAMVEDIRAVLVRLASRTQTLRFMAKRAGDATGTTPEAEATSSRRRKKAG